MSASAKALPSTLPVDPAPWEPSTQAISLTCCWLVFLPAQHVGDRLGKKKPKPREPDAWDGWAPTPEMQARAHAARPFFADWPEEQLRSIEELAAAFRFRLRQPG